MICAVLGDGWRAKVWENLGWICADCGAQQGKPFFRQFGWLLLCSPCWATRLAKLGD